MLATRIKTAVLLGLVLALVLFVLPDYCWVIFCSALVGVAFWEWLGLTPKPYLTGRKRIAVAVGLALLLAGLVVAGKIALMLLDAQAVGGNPEDVMSVEEIMGSGIWHLRVQLFSIGVLLTAAITGSLFWLLLVPFWLAKKWRLNSAMLHFLVGLLLLVPAWMALLHIKHISVGALLLTLAVPWIADVGAYFAGRRFGKHKLAPNISPGKSWEGVAGAAICLLAFGLVLQQIAGGFDWQQTLGMAFFFSLLLAVSIMGDLFESLMKRQAGVKDSSNLLPGHGGVLDRIDSQLAVLPVMGFCALFGVVPN